MKKSLVISEQDNIAALLENDRVVEFFVNRGELLLGDIYTATVENILPGIDAAFVNLGKDKMGFLHANDVPGQGALKERLVPKQKLLVQITKEPTGHKGPRVSTAISLPGRFLVLVPEERGISISRRISEAKERARLKSIVNLLKPPGVGLIIRTEAKGQGEGELFEDFEQLWDRWQSIVSDGEASIGPTLIYRDMDLLYRVIRDAYSTDINEVIVDSPDGQRRGQEYLSGWAGRNTQVVLHSGDEPLLVAKAIDREIEAALSDRVELPSGGHLNIQPTEALTVIDVNSGRFTSSRTQAETVRRTNLEAAQEIPRQLRLRNIGGMVIVDFIDMESRKDQQQVLEAFQRALEEDRAKPQIGQLSDLGLVELTRRRQGQSLRELFTVHCPTCIGLGVVPTLELGAGESKRVITVRPKEEEVVLKGKAARRASLRAQGSALRAATVSSGRIQSTVAPRGRAVEVEEALAEVPREILEQVPDELLEGATTAKAFRHEGALSAEVDVPLTLEEEAEEFEDELAVQSFAPRPDLFEQSEPEDTEALHEELGLSVRAAEQVRQELDAGVSETDELEEFGEAGEPVEPPLPYSPFEAEPDEIAGVFRLKVKPAQPAQERSETAADQTPDVEVGEESRPPYEHEGGKEEQGAANQSDASEKAGQGYGTGQSDEREQAGEPDEQGRTAESQESASWWADSGAQQLELSLSEPEETSSYSVSAFPGGLFTTNQDASEQNEED
jgi:ribonuclease E